MRISPVKYRNTEFRLILSYVDIKKFLVKGFRQEINKINLVDYLAEILRLTRVIQKLNCTLLAIPFALVRKLTHYSNSSFYTNTIEKDISFTRKGDSFLDDAVVNYQIQTKIITKLQGFFAIIVISKLVGTEAYKFNIYFPQLKRSFEFTLFKQDIFAAEVGLHKQAIKKGSTFNQTIGFRRMSTVSQSNEITEKSGKPSTTLRGRDFVRPQVNLKIMRKPESNLTKLAGSKRRISQSRGSSDTSRVFPAKEKNPSSIRNPVNLKGTAKIKQEKLRNFLQLNDRVLIGLDDISPKSVLEDYSKYEQKSFEIIRFEVMSHRQVNLKHTRECIETFANPSSLLIASRWRNYVKFYSAFYWRCMIQMLLLSVYPKCLRVTLSKFEDRLKECIESRICIIKGQQMMVGIYLHHDSGFSLEKLTVNLDTKVEVVLTNKSRNYSKMDVLTFSSLVMTIRSKRVYPYSKPTAGNLKIACAVGCRNVMRNLEHYPVKNAEYLLFIEKNMRLLLAPTIDDDARGLSILGLTKGMSFSPSTTKSKLKFAFNNSNMNLSKRMLKEMGLDGSVPHLILLIKKVFLTNPFINLWIFLNKANNKILFMFYIADSCQIRKRSINQSLVTESLPYLDILLQMCAFFKAGERIYAAMKNEMIRLYHLGTLFE